MGMMKKRVYGILFAGLILSMLVLPMVSAFNMENEVIEPIKKYVGPVVKFILGDVETQEVDGLLLIKLLVFILAVAILYYAVQKVPFLNENQTIVWTVSVIIGILMARLLTNKALINLVWLPSGVVGIALVSLLPFILYFFVVESGFDSKVVRRVAWSLFGVLFLFLAAVRWEDLTPTGKEYSLGWVYIATAALALLSLLFDKSIRTAFEKAVDENLRSIKKNDKQAELKEEYEQVLERYSRGHFNKTQANKKIDHLSKIATSWGITSLTLTKV
jgi:hypothetical protein